MTKNKTSARKKRPKRDRESSEDRFRKAAIAVFAKHGFAGAKTRMIARRAKLNESLIARYFGGKEGLFNDVVDRLIHEIVVDIPYPEQATLYDELTEYVKTRMELHFKYEEGFLRIALSQALVDNSFAKTLRGRIPRGANPILRARLQKLFDLGKIRADLDLDLYAESLDIHIGGILVLEHIVMARSQADLRQLLFHGRDVFYEIGRVQK